MNRSYAYIFSLEYTSFNGDKVINTSIYTDVKSLTKTISNILRGDPSSSFSVKGVDLIKKLENK